jgi:1-phosphofructokinase
MILTVTPNPTIDRVIFVRGFQMGAVVRAESEMTTPSGKGVDASLVIHELGADTVALGLNAGLSGRWLCGLLDAWGVRHDFVDACGETRRSVVMVDRSTDEQSTISVSTLRAGPEHLDQLLSLLGGYADRAWGVILGGSLPLGLPLDSYAHLVRYAHARGLVTLLDSSGAALSQGVAGLPHVLKVNHEELAGLDACLAGRTPDARQKDALVKALVNRLGEWASEAVLVTWGARGVLAATREGSYHVLPPDVETVNTAGAGDAVSAGVMLARSQGADWPASLALGTAAAASVVMNQGTALCRLEEVEALLPQVRVERLTPSVD